MILVVFGPGGVGKSTLVQEVLGATDRLWLSRSWTTRPRRPGEAADAYTFVDEAAFEAHLAAGGFLEHTRFPATGHLYGTPLPEPPAGHDVLLEIDLDGARQVKARYPDAMVVLVVAPSTEVQEARLRARGDDEGHIARRLELGAAEEAEGRRFADHVVVNDVVERAAGEVAGILERSRSNEGVDR